MEIKLTKTKAKSFLISFILDYVIHLNQLLDKDLNYLPVEDEFFNEVFSYAKVFFSFLDKRLQEERIKKIVLEDTKETYPYSLYRIERIFLNDEILESIKSCIRTLANFRKEIKEKEEKIVESV